MKRVLFVESGVFGGGSFTSLKKHIRALDLNKVSPIVVFFNDNESIEHFRQRGIKTYLVNDVVFSTGTNKLFRWANALFMKGWIRVAPISWLSFIHRSSILELIKICKEENVDYIHLNTELFRDRVGLLAGAKLNIPVISHLRSKYATGTIHYNKRYVEFANRHVTRYIAVSRDTELFWNEQVGVDREGIKVLYDYYEPPVTAPSDKAADTKGKIKFICVANLIPVKGHSFLLSSIAPVLKKYDAELELLGHGETRYTEELKGLVKKLGIEDYVKFKGYVKEVYRGLKRADFVLLFSQREGLPNVLIEALGLGCIVIATHVGGIPELIQDGETGFLVEYGNQENVIKVMEEAMAYPQLEQIRERGRQKIEQEFSLESYKDQIETLYI